MTFNEHLDDFSRFDSLSKMLEELKFALTRSELKSIPRYGWIEVSRGELRQIRATWTPKQASYLHQWIDQRFRWLPSDTCRLYFSRPLRCPKFVTINYLRSGPDTRWKSVERVNRAIEGLARLSNADAIVCQSIHPRLNDRVMARLGFDRHAFSLPGRHYIKRLTNQLRGY